MCLLSKRCHFTRPPGQAELQNDTYLELTEWEKTTTRTPLIESLWIIVEIECDSKHVVQQNKFFSGLLCVWGTGRWQGFLFHAEGQQQLVTFLFFLPGLDSTCFRFCG